MKDISNKIRNTYYAGAILVLADYPHEQAAFEKAWAAGKMREACLIVDETVRSRNLTLTDEFRKTDEDFYWEFVN